MSEENLGEKEEWRREESKIQFFRLFHIVSLNFSTKFMLQVFI